MKKINVVAILFSILLFSGNIYAESTPLTAQNILGTWKLEYTKKSQKTDITHKRQDTWVFNKKGKVIIKNIPREGGFYDQLPVDFEIENNNLKISILGRVGKFDTFSLVSKGEKKMILKARFGDIYQFIKK